MMRSRKSRLRRPLTLASRAAAAATEASTSFSSIQAYWASAKARRGSAAQAGSVRDDSQLAEHEASAAITAAESWARSFARVSG